MNAQPCPALNRRAFLSHMAAAGGVGLTGLYAPWAAAEPPPETRRIRINFDAEAPVLCYGPQYVATELLHLEGFEEVSYAPFGPDHSEAGTLVRGEADITANWAGDFLMAADRGGPLVALSGLHIGCTEIFAGEKVRHFSDLKGKKVALYAMDSVEHIWFASMVAYIGLDPKRDIEWVLHPYENWASLLAEGQVDAVMLWPPATQEYREKNIGHVIMNTTTDRPWRDYFCCMVAGNRQFVEKHPVATKRALRAILKAADLCALEPERAANAVVNAGLPFQYDRAVQVFREIPYAQWREYDPADTLRFYALRLRAVGMLDHNPEDLVAAKSEWRFLDELKQELKA